MIGITRIKPLYLKLVIIIFYSLIPQVVHKPNIMLPCHNKEAKHQKYFRSMMSLLSFTNSVFYPTIKETVKVKALEVFSFSHKAIQGCCPTFC